jgi:hypothetical protein
MVLRMTAGQAGDEAHHDDGGLAAPEDDKEQRIHLHCRRRSHRGDPGFGRLAQEFDAIEQHPDADAEQREQHGPPRMLPAP